MTVLRIAGKRTLNTLGVFDLVLTVALGSTLATTLLSKSVVPAEDILAMALLVFLRFVITWLSVPWPWVEDMVKSEPTLIGHRGSSRRPLHAQRITREEVMETLQSCGASDAA